MVEALTKDGIAERERLKALAETGLMWSAPEQAFDDLVMLAREICGTAYSAMTLLDAKHAYAKAASGIPASMSLPRQDAFCNRTIAHDGVCTIPDTHADEEYAGSPLVVDAPHVRFYAGVALRTEEGDALGALCVLDTEPRELTEGQSTALRILARQAEAQVQLQRRMQEQARLAAELAAQQELLHTFLDALPMEAYAKAEDGTILFYNRKLAEKFNLSGTEWIGKKSSDLWDKATADTIRQEEEWVLRANEAREAYLEVPDATGQMRYWKSIKSPLRLQGGQRLLACVAMDLTAELAREAELQMTQDNLEQANCKLKALALTDELTTLWNRRAFDTHLELELFRAQHHKVPLTLLMLDVDDFKSLNDTYGHSHGDEVLQLLSAALRRALRGDDFIARYGGEEFAVVLPATDSKGAEKLCRRINETLRQTRWTQRSVTISIGIAEAEPGCDRHALLAMADAAMYRAKRAGKNCAVVHAVAAKAEGMTTAAA